MDIIRAEVPVDGKRVNVIEGGFKGNELLQSQVGKEGSESKRQVIGQWRISYFEVPVEEIKLGALIVEYIKLRFWR